MNNSYPKLAGLGTKLVRAEINRQDNLWTGGEYVVKIFWTGGSDGITPRRAHFVHKVIHNEWPEVHQKILDDLGKVFHVIKLVDLDPDPARAGERPRMHARESFALVPKDDK